MFITLIRGELYTKVRPKFSEKELTSLFGDPKTVSRIHMLMQPHLHHVDPMHHQISNVVFQMILGRVPGFCSKT